MSALWYIREGKQAPIQVQDGLYKFHPDTVAAVADVLEDWYCGVDDKFDYPVWEEIASRVTDALLEYIPQASRRRLANPEEYLE